MGLGTSKYRKVMRTPQSGENAGKKLWYATAVSDRDELRGLRNSHL